MAIINVTVKTSSGFLKKQIETITALSQRQMFKLAKATEIAIRETIRENTKRPGSTGLLADSFHAVMTTTGAGVGVISFLNKEVPYWRHQNWGSLAIGANWQHWVGKGTFQPGVPQPDTGSFRDGRFIQNLNQGGKMYSFFPRNPIPAMNYLEKSLTKIMLKINLILKNA